MADPRLLLAGFLFVVVAFGAVFVTLPSATPPEINISTYEEASVERIVFPEFVYDPEFVASVDARIFEVYSGHAWQEHGQEVNAAFRCLGDNGSSKAFKTTGFTDPLRGGNIPTNVWLCFDGVDWYAIVSTAFEKVGGNHIARLVTAYKVSKELFPTIADYTSYLISKWGAREIAYMIEAGHILLSPK